MPIYVYKCEESGNTFEVSQSINSAPLTKCTIEDCSCGGNGNVYRVISKNVGLVFNGSGFYSTDYANKPAPPNNSGKAHPACCSCCSSAPSCPTAAID